MATKKPNDNKKTKTVIREEARIAFEKIRPRLEKLQPQEVLKPHLQVSTAAGIVLAAEPRIVELIPEIEKRLPDFPVARVRELRDLALAALYADASPVPHQEERKVRDLVNEGTELRNALLLEAQALAARKLLDAGQVADLSGGRGYRNVAHGLVGLARLFRASWDAVQAKTAATLDELARAEALGVELVEALANREMMLKRETAQGEGLRALTFLVQTYDEVRSAVVYLRWKEKDAEQIAPSIYSRRAKRRATEEAELDAPEAPDAAPPVSPETPAPPPASTPNVS